MVKLNTVSSGRLSKREGDEGNVVSTSLCRVKKKRLVKIFLAHV